MKSVVVGALLVASIPAADAQSSNDTPRAPLLSALAACRTMTDAAARLACYDRNAAQLDDAERRGDLLVADRAEVQKNKRSLFGLNLPSFDLFKRGKVKAEEIQEIESTIAGASYSNLKWTVVLADGARWRQTEPQSILDPRKGDQILIRRAALGSYVMKINKGVASRVERVN